MPTRPTAHGDAVEIRGYLPDDEAHVLELLRLAFGAWPLGIEDVTPAEFFRWKHFDGSFGPSRTLVAQVDGVVIGFWAFMPWRFTARGELFTTIRSGDLAVDASHRRRGVSMAFRASANFSSELDFTWSQSNAQSRPGAVKAGSHPVGPFVRFARRCGSLRETIKRAGARGLKTPARLQVEADTASEVLADSAYASRVLTHSLEPSDRLATAKDLGYLRWRYGRFAEYRAVRADAGRGDAMAIFRARRHGPFWALEVSELLVEHSDLRTARHLLQCVGRTAPADVVTCNFISHQRAALCGFVRFGGTDLMSNPLRRDLVPDPTRRDSWALSRGDLELL